MLPQASSETADWLQPLQEPSPGLTLDVEGDEVADRHLRENDERKFTLGKAGRHGAEHPADRVGGRLMGSRRAGLDHEKPLSSNRLTSTLRAWR